MNADLITTIEDGVATLTFNRPEFRNAVTSQMVQDATHFVASLASRSDIRCLVFRGAGDHFSSGGDVRNFGSTLDLTAEERRLGFSDRVRASQALFELIEALPFPVIAVVRGAVAGAGLGFTLAADIAVAGESAFFVVAHGKIGLAIDTGLSYLLPRAVGLRRAKELSLFGDRVDAAKALDYGIVCKVVRDQDLNALADTLISGFAKGATKAHGGTKALFETSLTNSIGRQIELEAEAVGRTAATSDFIEGVSSFLSRRPPVFTGQ